MSIRQSTTITAVLLSAFLLFGLSSVHAGDGCKSGKEKKGDDTTTLWQPAQIGTAVERR